MVVARGNSSHDFGSAQAKGTLESLSSSDHLLDIRVHMFYFGARTITTEHQNPTHDSLRIHPRRDQRRHRHRPVVLIDVMNGFIRGVTINHRLTAARLLTIYGFQDARDFIDDNTLPPSDEGRRWVITDPELARLIRARTNDGQEMCQFLIDVMWGRGRTHPHRTPCVSGQGTAEQSVREEPGHTTAQSSTSDRPQGNDQKDRPPGRACPRRRAVSNTCPDTGPNCDRSRSCPYVRSP